MDNEKRVQAAKRLAEIEGLMAHFDSVLSSEKKELEKLLAEADEEKIAPITFSQFSDPNNWEPIADNYVIRNLIRTLTVPPADYHSISRYNKTLHCEPEIYIGNTRDGKCLFYLNGNKIECTKFYTAQLILFNDLVGPTPERTQKIEWIEKLIAFRDASTDLTEAWADDYGKDKYPFTESFDELYMKITDWVEDELDNLT